MINVANVEMPLCQFTLTKELAGKSIFRFLLFPQFHIT